LVKFGCSLLKNECGFAPTSQRAGRSSAGF
jgi:hypothetical protein